MKTSYSWLIASLAMCLSGCATLSPDLQARFSQSVEVALTEAPDDLRRAADTGDGHAQLSYSIVLRYGLNGEAENPISAGEYRARAVASRGTTTTAIYVPGYKKSPGHTQLIAVPHFDVGEMEARAAEHCAMLLASGATPETAASDLQAGVCGGPDAYRRMQVLWIKARS